VSASASYFDPGYETVVTEELARSADLEAVLDKILALRSDRGHPALELQRADGSTLSIGTDGSRACLVWVDSLGASFHSVGGKAGPPLVCDHMGSWSETPGEWTVPLGDAKDCLATFLDRGTPVSERFLFEAE
jgi:hypothetical protein